MGGKGVFRAALGCCRAICLAFRKEVGLCQCDDVKILPSEGCGSARCLGCSFGLFEPTDIGCERC